MNYNLNVIYIDGDPNSYKGLILESCDKKSIINFNTGDVLIDFYNYYKFVYNGDALKNNIKSISHLSSYDHFFMDNDIYIEKYIIWDKKEEKYVFFNNYNVSNLSINEIDNCLKCIIDKNMKTIEELKEYYISKSTI